MQDFALVFLGLILGMVLCVIAFAAFLLYRKSEQISDRSEKLAQLVLETVKRNTSQLHDLQTEVAAALTKLDAAQLHEASLAIQRSAQRLARSVSMLYKLALSQDGTAAIAAEELAEEEISPYSGRPVIPADPATSPMGPAEVLAYQQRLQQKMAEIDRIRTTGEIGTIGEFGAGGRLPDIQEGWALDDAEFQDGGGGIA